ncbi:MAG: biotin--[acetyl-CoA-carboxylase] ligase [Lentisphaeria bacterium]
MQTAAAIIQALGTAGAGHFVSGAALCRHLGMSRTAVWKHIEQLRGLGYGIEAAPRRGYRLLARPDKPLPSEVEPLLVTARFGRELVYHDRLDSTNRLAGVLAEAGAAEGLTVVADAQDAGRGRLDRNWHSPAGANLYFSVVLRPGVAPQSVPSLALAAGLAVLRAVGVLCPHLHVGLKWPNDLWLGGRKLGGILCELRSELDRVHHVIVGIGLNVNVPATDWPAALAGTAVSLREAQGKPVSRPLLLAEVLRRFEEVYDVWHRDGLKPLLPELETFSILHGRPVRVHDLAGGLSGIAVGITPAGALLLEQADGTRREVIAGDVRVRPA